MWHYPSQSDTLIGQRDACEVPGSHPQHWPAGGIVVSGPLQLPPGHLVSVQSVCKGPNSPYTFMLIPPAPPYPLSQPDLNSVLYQTQLQSSKRTATSILDARMLWLKEAAIDPLSQKTGTCQQILNLPRIRVFLKCCVGPTAGESPTSHYAQPSH